VSHLLESLLDPTRRAACAEHDAIQFFTHPKGATMKHATVSAARMFADIAAATPVQKDRYFEITIARHGQPDQIIVQAFPDQLDAYLFAVEEAGDGAMVQVRSHCETSYFEGKEAYPRPLHARATTQAQAGWRKAQIEDECRRASDLRALAFMSAAVCGGL
jgi:hypothetical protein